MADQIINTNTADTGTRPGLIVIRQISWPAIFSGTLVALAVEVLFLSFGFFIGFRLNPGGASTWTSIWFWIGSFFSLMAGGWVAGRLGGNPTNGKVHGIVTWGLATLATFLFLAAFSWGVVRQGVGVVETAAVTTAAAAPNHITPNEADRMQTDANAAVNQAENRAPYALEKVGHDISTVSLVLWIGFMIAACGSLLGGAMGAPKLERTA